MTSQVLRRLRTWGRGRVFVPRDLLDLGSRQAIDVALHRLVQAGTIRRLGRGVYDYPKTHDRFGVLSAAMDDIARALSRSNLSMVAHSDASAANLLGLSTQVPARPVYLTDGPSRTVQVGSRAIRFAHASPSRMLGQDTKAGLVLRALRFLGRDGITEATIEQMRSILSDKDRSALSGLRRDAPSWTQAIVDRLVDVESTATA